jgi:hypothetical protein
MGYLEAIWKLYDDPDGSSPYTPYSFVPVGHLSPMMMVLGRDFVRREAVQVVPSMDGVLDGYGRQPGPMDRRDLAFSFRIFVTDGDLDKAYDLLAAQIGPGDPVRLVYRTDAGAQWFTIGYSPRIQHTLAAANRWGQQGYCDFTVTWRIRPDWRPRFSEASDVWGTNDGIWGVADGVWGGSYSQALATDGAGVVLDLSGTAGLNLPTIPDTGPVFTITGPFGGDNGFVIFGSQKTRDDLGNVVTLQVQVPRRVLVNQACILDCARPRFLLAGAPFRPIKPAYQKEYLRVDPGVLNTWTFTNAGPSGTAGGAVVIDAWRKRA